MRSKTSDILRKALDGGYAVGAFNTSNLEITQGIARAACELNRPCVIQATINSFDYVGDKVLGELVRIVLENESNSTKIGFHLDHGHSLDDVVRAIDVGVDSVMIDASRLSFKENIKLTKRVVDYAHAKGVSVQAELGTVPYLGKEEVDINWDEAMTDPKQAQDLVQQTGIDALAVGIGNAHGFYREREELDWERLKEIKKRLSKLPLIIHGASDWTKEKVHRAIDEGVCCFNIDTDIRIAFSMVLCKQNADRCDVIDPRKILSEARNKVQKKVKEKILMFSGQA
jgi:ketose-bisphosphate aldolase